MLLLKLARPKKTVYVCMYACMYVYTHIHTHIYTRTQFHYYNLKLSSSNIQISIGG